jgi:hypothetical protein
MIRLSKGVCVVVGLTLLAGAAPVLSQDGRVRAALDSLVAAYPDALAGHDGKLLRWRDGTVMPVSGETTAGTFPELLRHASLIDQLRFPYPRGSLGRSPEIDTDPGRLRNTAFFIKMYGNCHQGEVSGKLASVVWLPKTWGGSIHVTSVNGVSERLRAISSEIDALPEKIKRAAYPIADAYNCRNVADTGQPSPHSYGIAVDLNISASDYWYWRRDGAAAYRNRMPEEVVTIFEKHGFIWGGKWHHFDTMHFEYRPELLPAGGWASGALR